MRNLKRVLSLALALVMVLGMMVITTSAADFTDAEEITYTEAVEVMSALGVINGYKAADGTYYFDADKTLTRAEGAALVCYVLMGKTNADKLIGSGNFTDVPADHWAAGEIDYCYNLGFISGNGDGTFSPDGPLTSIGFGRMLLGALGIKGEYTGDNWATNIAAGIIDAGLDISGVAMDAQMTREQAAQMAFQALFVSEAAEKVTVYTINVTKDTDSSLNAVKAGAYASFTEAYLLAKEAQNGDDAWTVTSSTNTVYTDSLADKLFGLSYGDATDNFMRPATAYTSTMNAYKDVNDVLVVDDADLVIEGKILSKVLYSKVGYKAAGYTWANYVDGVYADATAPNATTATGFGATDDGTVMYVYIDNAAQTVTTNLVNTYIGEVKKVTAAKDGVARYVTLTNGLTFTTEEFAAKDVVLYTYSSKQVGSPAADAGIQSMAKAELVSGKLEKITSDGTYTVDGTDYVVSAKGATAIGAGNLGKTVSFYVDGYKNMMLDKGAAAAGAQYIFVLANSAVVSTTDYQTGVTKSLEVYGVDTAGNVVTATVSKIGGIAVNAQAANSLADTLYSYTVNATNGTYELTDVTTASTVAADVAANATTLTYNTSSTAIVNSDTSFVFVEQAKKGQGDLTVTGVTVQAGNASVGTAIDVSATPAYVVVKNGVAQCVIVSRAYAAAATATTNVTYIQHNVRNTTETVSTVAGPVTTYIYANAWNADGQLTVTNKTSVGATGLYKMNDDGTVGAQVVTSSGIITAINGNVITINGSTHLNVTDKTVEIYTGNDVELLVGQTVAYKVNGQVATNLDYLVVTADIVEVADVAALNAALPTARPYETFYLTGDTYGSVNILALTAANVTIEGNGAQFEFYGVNPIDALPNNLTIKNVVFFYNGISMTGGSVTGLTVENCVFRTSKNDDQNTGISLSSTPATDLVIRNCTFEGGCRILLGTVNGLTIENCKFDQENAEFVNCTSILISNCAGESYIRNNTIKNSKAHAIAITTPGTNLEISKNTISNPAENAIRMKNVNAAGIVINGNTLSNINDGFYAVKIDNGTEGATISYNGQTKTVAADGKLYIAP